MCANRVFYYLVPVELPKDPCNPSPCGPNAQCSTHGSVGSCTCFPNYFGDAYAGCRPECVQNSDCPRTKACLNRKCGDPCPGSCGVNANCRVINHSPECTCKPGYTGNPLHACKEHIEPSKIVFIPRVIYP